VTTLAAETRAEIERQRDRYPRARSAILPALWALQHQVGYLSPEGMGEVAGILGLAPSEVEAVASFYSMFLDRAAGRHHVLVCVNVSCALRGSDEIVAHLEETLGCASGGTTADGEFTWEQTVECLGACGGAPAMQVDHHFHENLTKGRVDAVLERVRGTPPEHGPADRYPSPRGPHPPAAQTTPLTAATGPPSTAGEGRQRRVRSADAAKLPVEPTAGTPGGKQSASRPRRRARDLDGGRLAHRSDGAGPEPPTPGGAEEHHRHPEAGH